MKSICVFCGSSPGNHEYFVKTAESLGEHLAKNKIRLVYGGASIGVMGALANSCLKNGGEVVGIIPKSLYKIEIAHPGLTQMHVVESMHDRKKLMYELSDLFVAMPGGFGTLDELFEILTWRQLSFHSKPIFLLNVVGFFDHLLKFTQHQHDCGFVSSTHFQYVKPTNDVHQLMREVLHLPTIIDHN